MEIHKCENCGKIAQYMLGGRTLYVRECGKEETGRFGIPRRNDLIF